jgi:fucose permease
MRGWVLALACWSMMTIAFVTAAPAVWMPAIAAELGLDYARQGGLFSTMVWAFGVAVASAAAADRVGFRIPLVAGSLLAPVGWLILAHARTYALACLGAAVVGLALAVVDPLLTPLVCALNPERRGRMANFVHAFFCVGLVATALLMLALSARGFTWRESFCVLAWLSVPHVPLALVIPLPPQTHEGEERRPVRNLLRPGPFWLLVAAIALAGMTEIGTTNWLPTFIGQVRAPAAAAAGAGGGSVSSAGIAAMLLFGGLMGLGRFLTSVMETRLGLPRLIAGSAVLSAAAFAVAALPVGAIPAAAALGIGGFGLACFWPSVLAIAGNRFPQGGASMFAVLSAAGGLGCFIAPWLIGWTADRTGSLPLAMGLLALCPLGILAALRHRT